MGPVSTRQYVTNRIRTDAYRAENDGRMTNDWRKGSRVTDRTATGQERRPAERRNYGNIKQEHEEGLGKPSTPDHDGSR